MAAPAWRRDGHVRRVRVQVPGRRPGPARARRARRPATRRRRDAALQGDAGRQPGHRVAAREARCQGRNGRQRHVAAVGRVPPWAVRPRKGAPRGEGRPDGQGPGVEPHHARRARGQRGARRAAAAARARRVARRARGGRRRRRRRRGRRREHAARAPALPRGRPRRREDRPIAPREGRRQPCRLGLGQRRRRPRRGGGGRAGSGRQLRARAGRRDAAVRGVRTGHPRRRSSSSTPRPTPTAPSRTARPRSPSSARTGGSTWSDCSSRPRTSR